MNTMSSQALKWILRQCLFVSGVLLVVSSGARGAARTVYFNASGMNRTVEGLSSTAQSTCKITITNPSTLLQFYSLTSTPTSVNNWSAGSGGSPTASVNAVSVSGTGCTSVGSACTGTLAAGASVTITFTYTTYPARPTTTAFPGKQHLRCSGSITATDDTNPGFLIASGVLVTFVESARMTTDASTAGAISAVQFGGIAVYTQVPITINRGKPF